MKKFFFLLMMAFFATISFTLVSCSNGDDEPNENPNEISRSVLKINGIDTYSCVKWMGIWGCNGSFFNGVSPNTSDKTIEFECDTNTECDFDKLDDYSMYDIREKLWLGSIRFSVKSFDYKNAVKGMVLTPTVEDIRHFNYIERKNGKSIEHSYRDIISGTITFESYTPSLFGEEIVTLRFNDVVADYALSYGDDSTAKPTITLDGLVVFAKHGED